MILYEQNYLEPNEPTAKRFCDVCHGEIYPYEDYYELDFADDMTVCEDCINECKRES